MTGEPFVAVCEPFSGAVLALTTYQGQQDGIDKTYE
jgi:hypothetical protein